MLTSDNALLNSLTDARRRYALSVLRGRRRETTESDLATAVASMESGEPLIAVSEGRHRRTRTDLRHRQLPKLAAAGLVRWDREAETVAAVDRRLPETGPATELLDDPTAVTDAEERMLEEVAHPRRRAVLSALESGGSMSVDELGERVAATADGEDLEAILVSLHHADLPKLEATDLLTYDGDAGSVTYRGHEAFDARWLDESAFETTRAEPSTPSAETRGVSTIVGRESVVSYAQSMFEAAEEELFVMITTDGLLEEGCVTRLRDAVDRGVEVYVGSRTRSVRDVVRRRVPGATMWEPQSDWLNLPPRRERLGHWCSPTATPSFWVRWGNRPTAVFDRKPPSRARAETTRSWY